MTRLLPRLIANQRGAAVIEMALIAPVFALMVIGIVDVSNAYTRKLALEQGAQRAIEKIMQTTEADTVENTLKTEAVCQVNGLSDPMTCNTSPISVNDVTVTFRLECYTTAGALASSQTNTDSTVFDALACPATQKEARYIEVAVADKYTPLFPIHFAGFTNSDGTYHLSAKAGMRTE